jgi:hypothetical protein
MSQVFDSITLNKGLEEVVSIVKQVIVKPYHVYLCLNYIFNVLNWRLLYNDKKYPKLKNVQEIIDRKLKFDLSPKLLTTYSKYLHLFFTDFLLTFANIDILSSSP